MESFRALKTASTDEKKGPPSLLKVSDETNLFGKKMTAPWEETGFQPFYNRNMSIKNI